MIPRHRITLIRAESKNDPTLRDKAVKTFRKHHFSYYPVVDRKGENVLGILNVKDLLLLDSRGSISPLLRKPNFTARGQSLDKALSVMQKLDEQLSVVVDEHGNIDGVITLEDILQELIGEMSEERTLPQDPVAPTQAFAVDGVTTLHELKEAHGVSLPQSLYYSTLAGFIFDRMGKIPVTGDTIDFETWRFEISQMAVNRIKEVRIIPLKPSTSVDIS
jgi:CBS domain containing-hemolysin-like protein